MQVNVKGPTQSGEPTLKSFHVDRQDIVTNALHPASSARIGILSPAICLVSSMAPIKVNGKVIKSGGWLGPH